MTIGEQIRAARKKRRMTQAALAQALGVSRQAISDVERGRYNLELAKLEMIATILKTQLIIINHTRKAGRDDADATADAAHGGCIAS